MGFAGCSVLVEAPAEVHSLQDAKHGRPSPASGRNVAIPNRTLAGHQRITRTQPSIRFAVLTGSANLADV